MLTIGVYGEGGGYSMLYHYDIKMADGQTHLLSARNHHDGWVYMRVYNAMIWDNDMMACTNYIRRGDWDAYVAECEYNGGPEARARMRALVGSELALARRLYVLARRHSVLAYEASNHYYYLPLDLVEKVINCRHVLEQFPLPK